MQRVDRFLGGGVVAADRNDLEVLRDGVQLLDHARNIAVAHAAAHQQQGELVVQSQQGACALLGDLYGERLADRNADRRDLIFTDALAEQLGAEQVVGNDDLVGAARLLPQRVNGVVGDDADHRDLNVIAGLHQVGNHAEKRVRVDDGVRRVLLDVF